MDKKNLEGSKQNFHPINILKSGPFPKGIDITKREVLMNNLFIQKIKIRRIFN